MPSGKPGTVHSINVVVHKESDPGDDDGNGKDDDNDKEPEPTEGPLSITLNGDDVTDSTINVVRTQVVELSADLEDSEDAEYTWIVEDDSKKVKLTPGSAEVGVEAKEKGEATITVASGEATASVTFEIEALTITSELDTDYTLGAEGKATATIAGSFDGADDTIEWTANPSNAIAFTETETASGEAVAFEIIEAGDVSIIATSRQDSQVSASRAFTAVDPSVLDTANIYVGDWRMLDPDWVKGSPRNPFEDFADTNDDGDTALNLVAEHGTIHVADGTYSLTKRLELDTVGVTLKGESENGTLIDLDGSTSSYGLHVTADEVAIESLTVEGGSGYAFKVGTGAALDGFTMNNVTVLDSKHTGVDLNGVTNVTLTDVTVEGTSTGAGISMTAADGVMLDRVSTSNNAWGGVGIYIDEEDQPVSNVHITSSNFDEGDEAPPVYAETQDQGDGNAKFSAFNFEGFDYAVYNPGKMDNGNLGVNFDYYFNDLDDAAKYAHYLEKTKNKTPFADRSTIQATDPADTSERGSDWFVEEDLNIQAAVDLAGENNTINVGAGAYPLNDHIIVNKRGLTIQGNDEQANPSTVVEAGFHISAPDVRLLNFRIESMGAVTDKLPGVYLTNDVSNVEIRDNGITNYGQGNQRGILFAAHAETPHGPVVITGNTINNLKTGIYTEGDAAYDISFNTFTNNTSAIGNARTSGSITSNTFNVNDEGIGLSHENTAAPTVKGNTFTAGDVFVTRHGNEASANLEDILEDNTFPADTGIDNDNNAIRIITPD